MEEQVMWSVLGLQMTPYAWSIWIGCALALGMADTRMNSHLSEMETAEIRDQIPAGYIVTPEETGQAVLRLLQMPEYFTGEIVKFDGGWI